MDNLDYSGPSNEYIPLPGSETDDGPISPIPPNPIPTYADMNYLNRELSTLIAQCNSLLGSMETILSKVSLVVTTDPNDSNLVNANEVLWPKSLGAAPNYITYLYYSSLENVNSAAANFVRNAYQAAAQGVTGSNAIDLLPLAQITLDEATLIQDFANLYAGALSDSSQRRTVELLQDWVESAQGQMITLENSLKGNGAQLSSSELSSLSASDAQNAQAILHVSLNQLNVQLNKSMGVLQQSFANYQTTFYKSVLGPAMNVRTNAINKIYPAILPESISQVISTSTQVLDTNLQNVLTDQMRRNNVYTSQMPNIMATIQARDTYRSYIIQLSTIGQSIVTGTSGTIVTTSDTINQAAYFNSTTAPAATPNNPYQAPHSQLSGLSDLSAHSQYLLKGGDVLSGNLTLSDNALIDGITPSSHAHTGLDGSVQIKGSDILPGSVNSSVVDTLAQPETPTNLNLVSEYLDNINGGVDISISWSGDPSLTFEVQIAKAITT